MASVPAGSAESNARPVGDVLLTGVFVMLIVNGLQRVVGLARGLGFCHFLSEDQLGGWALANSFFVVGVPLALLGLPGSFSKFVEFYRVRNQLGNYLSSVLAVTSFGLLATLGWMLCLPSNFCWVVFEEPSSLYLVGWCAVAFLSLILFSIVYEVVASLRCVRLVSIMQFLQSTIFAVVGLALIAASGKWVLLLPSYAIACCIATLPGVWVLYRYYRQEFTFSATFDRSAMWVRILPYAASLWVMNLLSNMFEVSDRYMLLHLSTGGAEVGQALVGQYHCGRILPNLLISVALMLGGVLLPFLSADWEAGNQAKIAARIKQMLQSASVMLMAVSVAALLATPYLFQYGFSGRYAEAEAILPLSMLHAIWVSLFLIAETYMLCAERGKELSLLLVLGLACNLGLNWFCIQRFGLTGAVAATAVAGLFTLLLLYWRMQHNGCKLGWGTLALSVAPMLLLAGPVATTLGLVVIVVIAGRTDWLLSSGDREQIDQAVLPRLERLGIRLETLWL